jgi:probable poly-beta-1,6-N-acetyl-D-glucosamine export protein
VTRRLLHLNGLAVIGLILFHAAGWGFVAMLNWTGRYLPVTVPNYDQVGSLAYYVLRVMEQAASFAIPAFLFVSGYFVAVVAGRKRVLPWNAVTIRIKNLAIPYLLWSLLLMALSYIQGATFSVTDFLGTLIVGKANPAYYYVPLLIQFYLLSPILVYLARRYWLPLLIVTALVQSAVQALYYPALLGLDAGALRPLVDVVPKWLFVARIFWFTAGIVVAFHVKEFEQSLFRARRGVLLATLVLIPIGVVEWELIQASSGQVWLAHRETFLDTFYAAALILSVLAFGLSNRRVVKPAERLAVNSFGIYLVHSPVMEYVARIIYHLAPWFLAYQLLFVPFIALVGLGVPLIMMTVVKRSPAKVFYKYIFG